MEIEFGSGWIAHQHCKDGSRLISIHPYISVRTIGCTCSHCTKRCCMAFDRYASVSRCSAQRNDTHNQAGIAHTGGLMPLLKLLDSKNGSLQHHAAFALYGLAENQVEEYEYMEAQVSLYMPLEVKNLDGSLYNPTNFFMEANMLGFNNGLRT
ncbi:unnamed protein product [Trifolium pratense]|uniref:Uncharacterized protein n=1 Tax=Trifolium pratense TaxID=57577 RepID=A0ACB0LPY3_TRIPR|nr:unnamed protein product [Trifolium pratense]